MCLASRLRIQRSKKAVLLHMLSSAPYTNNQWQGRIETTGRIAKIITIPATTERSPDLSACWVLVLDWPRKTQHSSTERDNTFTHTEKRQSCGNSIMCVGPSWLVGAPGSWHRNGPIHDPLCCNRVLSGVCISGSCGCAWGPLIQSKGILIDPETGKDIPTHGDKPVAGWVGSLSLGKKIFQPQRPFLCSWVEAERLHTWDFLSQHKHTKPHKKVRNPLS